VTVIYKAYYFQQTIWQMLTKTHDNEKPSVWEFWISYNINTAIDIRASWG
jgi:hypothetical protein